MAFPKSMGDPFAEFPVYAVGYELQDGRVVGADPAFETKTPDARAALAEYRKTYDPDVLVPAAKHGETPAEFWCKRLPAQWRQKREDFSPAMLQLLAFRAACHRYTNGSDAVAVKETELEAPVEGVRMAPESWFDDASRVFSRPIVFMIGSVILKCSDLPLQVRNPLGGRRGAGLSPGPSTSASAGAQPADATNSASTSAPPTPASTS